MSSKLLLPVTLPLRVAALQLRLARTAAELALDVTREVAGHAPWAPRDDARADPDAPPFPVPAPTPPELDPVEPARAARRRAAVQRTRARPAAANGSDPAGGAAKAEPATRAASAEPAPPAKKATPARRAKPATPAKPRSRRAAASGTPASGRAAGGGTAASGRAASSRTPATRPAAARPTPPADTEPPPKPRARRTARKATADKPKRSRTTGPTPGEAAAIREAQRETEGTAPIASAGPETGAGPEIRVEAPWPGYDDMRLDEVLDRLAAADETLLAAVRLYESQHESRQAVLLATERS